MSRPGSSVAPIQRSLWSFHHFYPVEVEHGGIERNRAIEVFTINAHRYGLIRQFGGSIVAANAANIDLVEHRILHDIQAGRGRWR